jgi:uncharacterized membrane protein
VPFPVAFLAGAIVTDILYCLTGASMWANASLWLIGGTAVVLPIVAMEGFAASTQRGRRQTTLSWQQLGFLAAIGLVMLDWFPRYEYGTAIGFPSFGILVSLASLGILAISVKLGSGASPRSAKDTTVSPAGEPSSIMNDAIPGR